MEPGEAGLGCRYSVVIVFGTGEGEGQLFLAYRY